MLDDGRDFELYHGDCVPFMAERMEPASVHHAVMSVPFPSVYSYTSLPEDLGNSEDLQSEAKLHFSWFFRGLRRVLMPGRVAIIHCQQIVRMKRAGGQGLYDFRGLLIRLGQRAGLVYDYDWLIRKPPQEQAIRTKSRSLQFAGLEADRAQSRGALCDYLIKFVCPGENAVAIDSPNQVTRNRWIDLAEGAWMDIRGTDTLNVTEARGPKDVKHICALQLQVIENCVRLYSNPDEIIFSPFCGIGSEGYIALKLHRRFVGCEIKDEYVQAALKNLERAKRLREESEKTLFDLIPAVAESTTS
jgi:hypothetical protein